MSSVKRRAAYYLLLIAGVVAISSVAYDLGMKTFEPRPYPPDGTEVSMLHSMQVVVETFTATGYGSDSPWHSAEMNALVMVLDLTGVALFFLALPAVFLPLFRQAMTPSVPTAVEEDLRDHVVICTYTTRVDSLVAELDSHGVEHVLVEPDRDRSADLQDEGHAVVHGDPESIRTLERVNLGDARALVADVADRTDASIVLAAREVDEAVRVISVVEDPDLEAYHRLAGADSVFMPRAVLGESLAGKVTTAVSTDLGDAVQVGEDFDIVELPIHQGSELVGSSLADSRVRERFGVNVIGAWVRGEFESPPPPDTPLDSGTIMLVTGHEDQLERLKAETVSTVRRLQQGQTIVVGYGEVGRTVADALAAADVPYTVVDRQEFDGVDVVGDGTDPDVLLSAGVDEAESVVLALGDDTDTEFATLVVRNLNDSAEIIARADRTGSVRKTYRAGADYVLSLATVSGRSIASQILDREEILSMGTNVEVVRTTAPGLEGVTIEQARVRDRTGCTVVAVERNGDIATDLDPAFTVEPGDELVIAGTDEGTNRFVELFG